MKYIINIFLLFLPQAMLAQSNNQNYLMTETMLTENGSSKITNIQYCDGLGRPNIQATTGLNTSGETAYSLKKYDDLGRVNETWLPAVGGTTLDWKTPEEIMELSKQTNGDGKCYTETAYDAIGRTRSISGPGEKWKSNNKDVQNKQFINVESGNNFQIVKCYSVNDKGELVEKGVWPKGALTGEEVIDEDNKSTMVFTDFFGHKVLERRKESEVDFNDTYYIYNDYDQLRYVLSPMYQKENNLEKYAYEYRYDGRSRCIYKRLPGCKPVEYWYDNNNRMIFMQNGELRNTGRCRFYFYDTMGRQVLQGTCSNQPKNLPSGKVTLTSSEGVFNSGYIPDITLSNTQQEIVNYYDNYNFLNGFAFKQYDKLAMLTKTSLNNATGQKTGSIINTTEGKMLYGVDYYTAKGLPCETRQSMLDGKVLFVRTNYSFTDKAQQIVYELYHSNRRDSVVLTNTYSSKNDALLTTSVAYNGGTPHLVSNLSYDNLGRQIINGMPGNVGNITNSYNVRGWMTGITNNHYSENISYDGLYNGNIASIENLYTKDIPSVKYTYTYDMLNRLTQAASSMDNAYTETASYDKNGNFKSLNRWGKNNKGQYGAIDALGYTYNGNQVESINDPLGGLVYDGSFDFKPLYGTGRYQYNSNGAMTHDPNKGIEIEYSETGTPSHIQFYATSNYTGYNYGADGTKMKVYWGTTSEVCKQHSPNDEIWDENGPTGEHYTPTENTGDIVRNTEEYCGPFIFINGVLDKIIFNWGYCTLKDGNANFHYYIHDHIGSTRAVIAEDGTVEQQTGYYPFGGVYGDVSTNSELQGFKYTGKELDHQHGLDAYDFGARMYDPATAVWTSMDPLCEKYYNISPYTYCVNNPVKFMDPDGMAPGDPFATLDEAALNFARIYNYWSIMPTLENKHGSEYTCTFYTYTDEDGETRYSYFASGPQDESSSNNINDDTSQVPEGRKYTIVGTGHTHAGENTDYDGNVFSPTDIDEDINTQKKFSFINSFYLATTNGTLKKHWHNKRTKKWMFITFKGDKYKLPSDANDSSHGKYTYQSINKKYYDLPWYYRFMTPLNKYLEERLYK